MHIKRYGFMDDFDEIEEREDGEYVNRDDVECALKDILHGKIIYDCLGHLRKAIQEVIDDLK